MTQAMPPVNILFEEFHLDYETRSKADLTKVGAYRYAEDKSTQILMAAIATKNEGPFLWVNPEHETSALRSDPRAFNLLARIGNPEAVVYAHNAEFERAISRSRLLRDIGVLPPKPEQWRCTAAMSRRAALPAKLETVGGLLGLTEQKDARGKKLIQKFSIPRKKDGEFNKPCDHAKDFADFGAYCLQDVRTEKQVHLKLKAFELVGQPLRTFQLDSRINDRGLPVNVQALKNAQKIIEEVNADLSGDFYNLVGLLPTQGKAFKAWLSHWGTDLPDLTADTLELYFKNPESFERDIGEEAGTDVEKPDVRGALKLFAQLNFAAAKKVTSMLNCVCEDGYVRGTLLYHGAGTGRWSGKLIQPQNFKRPTIKNTDIAYKMICDGCTRVELELLFGNALEVIASCIRHFIQPHAGLLLDADYAAIEARIVCWLAGQQDVLDDFANGVDVYKKMAAVIYNIPWEKIANPSTERTVGKHTVLGCGFSMWWPKFKETCAKFKVPVSDELAERAVLAYRKRHNKVEALWKIVENAAKAAIAHPGKVYQAGKFLRFSVVKSEGIPFLVMRLPSGRNIVYPWPKLEMDPKFGRLGITFYGAIEGKSFWGRVKTYGGKLVENATQATAADLMAYGSCNAEDEGFNIATLIHDQALAPQLDETQTPERFCEALTKLPPWAAGLPLAAEGKITKYYKK